MYTRHVSMKLKANTTPEFKQVIEKEIIPMLRKQKGFQNEISFVSSERNEAVGISFWDKKESAEAYNREGYPEILKALSKVLEGTPKVQTFELASSTSHELAALAA